jgi:hypothetical protein
MTQTTLCPSRRALYLHLAAFARVPDSMDLPKPWRRIALVRSIVALGLAVVVFGCVQARRAESFRATLPQGWARVPWRLTATSAPRQRYAAASFRMRRVPRGDCGPSEAVRAQMPKDSVVVIIEDWGPLPGKAFRALGRFVNLGRPAALECFGWAYNIPFAAAGRELQAFVLVRGNPGSARLNQTRSLLASVRS